MSVASVDTSWLRFTGSIDDLSVEQRRSLFTRATETSTNVAMETARIVADVRARGGKRPTPLAAQISVVSGN